jgi:hypothetical protein
LVNADQRPGEIRDYAAVRDTPLAGWEATALATAALVAGLPLGLLAGRWSWALCAGALGVAGGADVPVLLVLLTVPVTWLLTILIATWPARAAARVMPAAVLRAE